MQTAGADVRLDVSLAVFDRGVITLEHLELPDRPPRHIDVAISAAAICGSDLHTVLGHRAAPARTALGHEGVGQVIDIDDDAADLRGGPLRRGDRVVFSMLSACGTCDRCRAGLTMKCRSLLKYGHEPVTTPPHATGTLANRVRLLPDVPVLRIPADIDDVRMVSAGCAVATAAAVVDAAGTPGAGTRVLVLGAGAVGAYCAAMFAGLGCVVHVRDPSAPRLAVVERFGAYPDDGDGPPFSVVVEASGNAAAVVDALHAADIGGRVLLAGSVSVGSSTVTVDPALIVTRRLDISGIHNYTAENFRWGVDWLLAQGRHLGLEQLVSPPVPLADIGDAFRRMQEGVHARVLVHPNGRNQLDADR